MYMAGWECYRRLSGGSCLNPRNLTSAPLGLRNRSDDELRAMFLQGVRPAATADAPLHPAMPYWLLHNMTDGDADAVVAYLHTIPPVDRFIPRSGPEFEVAAPLPPLDAADLPVPAPEFPNRESALRGRYLTAETGRCIECHTPVLADGFTLDASRYFRGGRIVELPQPFGTMVAPALSPDGDLARWTGEDVATALTTGRGKDGRSACPPFLTGPGGAYAALKRSDVEDIANYLRSLTVR
jgi:hypothetical protein